MNCENKQEAAKMLCVFSLKHNAYKNDTLFSRNMRLSRRRVW